MTITVISTYANTSTISTFVAEDIDRVHNVILTQLLQIYKKTEHYSTSIEVLLDDQSLFRLSYIKLESLLCTEFNKFITCELQKQIMYNAAACQDDHSVNGQIASMIAAKQVKEYQRINRKNVRKTYWLKSDPEVTFSTLKDAFDYISEKESMPYTYSTFATRNYWSYWLTPYQPQRVDLTEVNDFLDKEM